ncbi:uncharacterized protein PS065_015638 [Dugong dugon]
MPPSWASSRVLWMARTHSGHPVYAFLAIVKNPPGGVHGATEAPAVRAGCSPGRRRARRALGPSGAPGRVGAAPPTPGGRRALEPGFRPRSAAARPGDWRPGGRVTRESSAAAAPQCGREKQRGGWAAIEAARSIICQQSSVLVVMEAPLSFL